MPPVAKRWGIMVILLILLSGCWSRVEVNDLGLVLGIGIDVGEELPIRLTLFIARTVRQGQGGGQGAGGDPVWIATREAATLSDAMREVSMGSARRISLHHVRVVLIGENLAREQITDILDFLGRNPQIRLTLRPMVVEGRAQTVLETPPQLKPLQPDNLVGIIQSKGGVEWRLKNFLIARVSETHSGWMHAVKVIDRPGGIPGSPKKAVVLAGAGLFRYDHLVTYLDETQAQSLSWLIGNPRDAVITAHCPNDDGKTLSASVLRGKSKIEPTLRGGRVSFQVHATAQVDLLRLECRESVREDADRSKLEEALAKDLRERLSATIEVFQSTTTDPVGFGKRVQRRYPAFFRSLQGEWFSTAWPKADVSISTDIRIRQTGLLLGPANRDIYEMKRMGQE